MLSLVSLGGGTTSYCLLLFPTENVKFFFNGYLLLSPQQPALQKPERTSLDQQIITQHYLLMQRWRKTKCSETKYCPGTRMTKVTEACHERVSRSLLSTQDPNWVVPSPRSDRASGRGWGGAFVENMQSEARKLFQGPQFRQLPYLAKPSWLSPIGCSSVSFSQLQRHRLWPRFWFACIDYRGIRASSV